MTEHLSDYLKEALKEQKTLELFDAHYRQICDRKAPHSDLEYANALHHMLEIAARTPSDDYVTLGGLAVLTYLAQRDEDAPLSWRGTDDIDLLAQENKLSAQLKGLGFQRIQGNCFGSNSDNGCTSFVTYVKEQPARLKVQVREDTIYKGRDRTNTVYKNRQVLPLYGIDITVPRQDNLISTKEEANRKKDWSDIDNLLGRVRGPRRKRSRKKKKKQTRFFVHPKLR